MSRQRLGGVMRAELQESFAAVATAELTRLRRFAYALVGDWYRADDLVQGALERMYVAWPRIHAAADPGAYARTVLARTAASETRRPWWRREQVTDVVPESSWDDLAPGAVERLDLAQALAGLTVKQRAVVVLRHVEDRPVDDVAEILGIAPGTVKRQCSDALNHLRRRLHVQAETSDRDPGPADPPDPARPAAAEQAASLMARQEADGDE